MFADALYNKGIELCEGLAEDKRAPLNEILAEFKSKIEEAIDRELCQKCESEKQYSKAVSELQNMSSALQKCQLDLQQCKANEAAASERFRMSERKVEEDKLAIERIVADRDEAKQKAELLRRENAHLQSAVDNRTSEINFLKSEIEFLEKKVKISTNENGELAAKNSALCAIESRLKNIELKADSERRIFQAQIDTLNGQVAEGVKNLMLKEREFANVTSDKESQIAILQQTAGIFEREKLNLRISRDEAEERIAQLIREKNELREEHDKHRKKFEEDFENLQRTANNVTSQLSLLQLQYKQKGVQLMALDKKLKEVKDDADRCEQSKNDEITDLKAVINQLNDKIRSQSEELDFTREQMARAEEKEQASHNESSSGLHRQEADSAPYGRLCDDINQAKMEVMKEREDNNRLRESLSIVLKEIKEKSPILTQQRIKYECAIERNSAMRQSIEALSKQMEIMSADNSMRARRFNAVIRENTLLKQENKDLSTQVRVLLHQTVPECTDEKTSVCTLESQLATTMGCSGAIDTSLVTFESIDELQVKNQQLMSMVRDLSLSKEQAEEDIIRERTSEMSLVVDNLTKKLDSMAQKLQTYKVTITTLSNQRDAYKRLLDSRPMSINDESLDDDSKLADGMTPNRRIECLERLVAENRKYMENQKELHDATYKQLKEENECLEREREEFRREVSDMKTQCLVAETKISENNEKIRSYMVSIDNLQCEVQSWTGRYNKLTRIQGHLENQNKTLNQSILCMNDKYNLLDAQKKSIAFDLENARSEASHYRKEKEVLEQSLKCNAQLLLVADTLKDTMEKSSQENRYMLEVKIASLERELNDSREKLDRHEKLRALSDSSHQSELNDQKQLLDVEQKGHNQTRTQLQEERLRVIDLSREVAELKTKLDAFGDLGHLKFMTLPSDKASLENEKLASALEELKQLQVEHRLCQSECENQRVRNDELSKELSEYKTLVSKLGDNSKSQMDDFNSQIETLKEKADKAEAELLSKQVEIESQNRKYNDLESSLEKIEDDYRIKETSLRGQVQEQSNRLLASMVELESLKAENKSLSASNKALKEQSEKELDTVKSLQTLVVTLENDLSTSTEKVEVLTAEVSELKSGLSELRSSKEQIEEEHSKCKLQLRTANNKYIELISDNSDRVAAQHAEIEKLALKLADKYASVGADRASSDEVDDKYLNLLQANRIAIKERNMLEQQLKESREAVDRLESEIKNVGESNRLVHEGVSAIRVPQTQPIFGKQATSNIFEPLVSLDSSVVTSCRDFLKSLSETSQEPSQRVDEARKLMEQLESKVTAAKPKSIFGSMFRTSVAPVKVETENSAVKPSDDSETALQLETATDDGVDDDSEDRKQTIEQTQSGVMGGDNSSKRLAPGLLPAEEAAGKKRAKSTASDAAKSCPQSPSISEQATDLSADSSANTGRNRIQPIVWEEGSAGTALLDQHPFEGPIALRGVRSLGRGLRRGRLPTRDGYAGHFHRSSRGGPHQR